MDGTNLTFEESQEIMREVMSGKATNAQIAAFLTALRLKGETVEERVASAAVMREHCRRIHPSVEGRLVDTCGTGGDKIKTFNISTTAAFVVAGAGVAIAKHGNRSVTSKSGSADVLEAAGVKLELTPEQVAECINRIGIGFMYAPAHHGAMKHTSGPRRELGVRTLFNLLGPLTNPAGATCQLIGVYSKEWLDKIAQVLRDLGSRQVLVVHAEDGMDEISITAPTSVAELKDGMIMSYRITPEQFGMQRGEINAIAAKDVTESLATMHAVLSNKPGAARDVVLLNAAAAIYTAGVAGDMDDGLDLARQALETGGAREKLEQLVILSGSFRDA